jgi:hypothetical protein
MTLDWASTQHLLPVTPGPPIGGCCPPHPASIAAAMQKLSV